MMSCVIGGARLPHAPQFCTMPETEERDTVERVKTAAAEIGTQLRALRPDLWIIFANDHVEQFFHTAAPPFTIHVGDEAKGEFAGRQFHWRVPGQIGFEIVRQMYAQGFDPAFTSVAKIDYLGETYGASRLNAPTEDAPATMDRIPDFGTEHKGPIRHVRDLQRFVR